MRILAFLLLATAAASPSIAQEAPATETSAPKKKLDVRWGPTPEKKIKQMLDLAGVKPGDVVYDLGSGDGRIPIAAARDYGVRSVGIELDPKWIPLANANAKAAGVEGRIEFRNEDIFKADFSDATVVTLFLWPSVNRRLIPKLMELKPGTRIVSYWHDMGKWKPEKTIRGGVLGGHIYLWTIPAR